MAPPSRGFTLVEALLALAIFGVIAVLAYRATASLTEGEARLSSEAARWRTLETLFIRFEADVRQAVPRAVRSGVDREPAWLGLVEGGQSALVFTRAGSEFAIEPAPAGQRVGYRLRNGILELAYWPHLDHGDNTQPLVYPLVADIDSFRLEYLARDGGWRDRWPSLGEDDIPRAVRLSLVLADGAHIDRWFALR
ncbi:MAG: type II secretion system minor pseudopilin GspJ [Burkholderiales bacterium]|nr:type II secretion system minor pseudopilin GspJ [Burkholderiales bacterium]